MNYFFTDLHLLMYSNKEHTIFQFLLVRRTICPNKVARSFDTITTLSKNIFMVVVIIFQI